MNYKTVYTLGTGVRSREDFIEILNSHNIEAVVDVRSFPKSKFEHFNRINLESFLREEMIEYHHLGDDLGGFRKGGYELYTRTKKFTSGIDTLENISSRKVSVILCAERFPWKCHRRFIARAIQQRGWRVVHIIDKGKVWVPQ